MIVKELNDEIFLIYAANNYYSPRAIDAEDFYEELNRFKYIKRLINRYTRGGELCERLILNHVIILLNVFGNEPAILMLLFKLGPDNLVVIKPFLEYLVALKEGDLEGIIGDPVVVARLETI
jgi:hypothetical protein|tara:strand:+ start:324 stop:689 length:366 start_codon:yes stop_codon:yes gene_type:complete